MALMASPRPACIKSIVSAPSSSVLEQARARWPSNRSRTQARRACLRMLVGCFFCRPTRTEAHTHTQKHYCTERREFEKNVCQLIYTSLSLSAPSTQSLSPCAEWTGLEWMGSCEGALAFFFISLQKTTDGP